MQKETQKIDFFKQNLDKIRRLLYLEILGEPVYDFKRSTQIK